MTIQIPLEAPLMETERFALRRVRLSDQGMLDYYAGDRRVAEMTTTIPHPLPPGAGEAFVARVAAPDTEEHVWVMDGTQADAPELMGVMSLRQMDRNQSELSFWIGPPFWNTGLASEAVRALVATNPLKNDTLFACVFQDNPASARVLVNCGFEYIGDAEAFSIARNAKVPTWTYIRKMS
ncbi:MAG: GNAT family N-acetyltransferase [Pelagimonas sp.]|jgi:RimJ/RimL family protein N-acetyltransferase|nr:GNAT family N-acetyltransferase [Pelagimonas sp.]